MLASGSCSENLYVKHMHSCSLYIQQKIVLITHLHYSTVTCYSLVIREKKVFKNRRLLHDAKFIT
jgi:hypothetical protein